MGGNSIIIVGGANMEGWGKVLEERELEVVRNARIVLLQREILDYVNIQVAKSHQHSKSGSSLQPLHKSKSTPSTPPPPPFASFPSLRDGAITEEEKRSPSLLLCESEALARKIAVLSDSIKLQSINWRYHLPTIRKNPIEIHKTVHIEPKREMIEIRIRGECRLFVASFTLVLPFFPTGSFERMDEEGDVATAFTMARILSNIPISRGGPTSLVIYDIHALQLEKRDGTPKDQLSSIKQTLKELQCKREE
ncbi:hypothetical protein Sjap_004937 [Stephania japonica]|uniref:Uncharacterized protein n=1 Tax=Stephania japonica TaxID=461633 RepID=A0AAP0K4G9_9MAGN